MICELNLGRIDFMKKKLILIILLVMSSSVGASTTIYCDMEPTSVKVGAIGGKENYLFVCGPSGQEGRCFNLGEGTDAQAKNRYSMAMTAVVSGLSLKIQYWSGAVESCDSAIDILRVPNTMSLMK